MWWRKRVNLLVILIILLVVQNPLAPRQVRAQECSDLCATVTEIPCEECQALVELYNSTAGAKWLNRDGWLQNNSPCTWFGVRCKDGHVTNLYLVGNNLSGPIPPELGNLTELRHLWLSWNHLTGNIPSELGQLSQLEVLELGGNGLQGSIPPELGNLTRLRYLCLYINYLSGSIPETLENLKNLELLDLWYNELSGPIPPWLGNLTQLRDLYLFGNHLSGSIPEELAGLSNLRSLILSNNELSGPIPKILASLTSLNGVNLSFNYLSGPIPSELGSLQNLSMLSLSGNELSGPIPKELGNLHQLTFLDLSGNQLTGPIPEELGSLPLEFLYLDGNRLSGSIPPGLFKPGLRYAKLSGNALSGSIPQELCSATDLFWLDLSGNYLTGPIPVPNENQIPPTNNCMLNLSHNSLTGTVPSWIEALICPGPGMVNLSYNKLTADPNRWGPQWPAEDPVGQNVTTSLGAGFSLTFGEVTVSGQTSVTTSSTPPVPEPTGFALLGIYYDVVSSTSYDPGLGITLTISYDDRGLTPEEEKTLALLHYQGGEWVDCTIARDTAANTITGHVSSLSWFAVATKTNAAPTLGTIAAPVDPKSVGALVQAIVPFSDPDVGDTHTATWDWGDGSTSAGVINYETGTILGEHTYTQPGVYTLVLTLRDASGETASATFQYVVVYDPEGGFVTGGGWIISPVGAYQPDPTLTGKATFGFVSKYKKGAAVPTGTTEFQFKVANLNFRSESYDWLVVAGPKAIYKGTGTINGAGQYGFMISAIDGQINGGGGTDKFRIKIWDKASGNLVYDNQLGSAESADPQTVIGGGSIVIHK